MSSCLRVALLSEPQDVERPPTNAAASKEFLNQSKPETPVAEDLDHLTDDELVLLAKGGDERAFGDLVQRHFPTCFKRALGILGNRSDAEDEVQNACSKALENLSTFRFEGPFSAWLCRIVQNQCLMLKRENKRAAFCYVDVTTHANARLELVNQTPDPEDAIGAEQVNDLLRRELSRVPPLMRSVLQLRVVEGLPMPDVAARLGLSVPAAKSRLMRARREMCSRLAKHCGSKGPGALTNKIAPQKAEYTYLS